MENNESRILAFDQDGYIRCDDENEDPEDEEIWALKDIGARIVC